MFVYKMHPQLCLSSQLDDQSDMKSLSDAKLSTTLDPQTYPHVHLGAPFTTDANVNMSYRKFSIRSLPELSHPSVRSLSFGTGTKYYHLNMNSGCDVLELRTKSLQKMPICKHTKLPAFDFLALAPSLSP